jgi:hypothetical protein
VPAKEVVKKAVITAASFIIANPIADVIKSLYSIKILYGVINKSLNIAPLFFSFVLESVYALTSLAKSDEPMSES